MTEGEDTFAGQTRLQLPFAAQVWAMCRQDALITSTRCPQCFEPGFLELLTGPFLTTSGVLQGT